MSLCFRAEEALKVDSSALDELTGSLRNGHDAPAVRWFQAAQNIAAKPLNDFYSLREPLLQILQDSVGQRHGLVPGVNWHVLAEGFVADALMAPGTGLGLPFNSARDLKAGLCIRQRRAFSRGQKVGKPGFSVRGIECAGIEDGLLGKARLAHGGEEALLQR